MGDLLGLRRLFSFLLGKCEGWEWDEWVGGYVLAFVFVCRVCLRLCLLLLASIRRDRARWYGGLGLLGDLGGLCFSFWGVWFGLVSLSVGVVVAFLVIGG